LHLDNFGDDNNAVADDVVLTFFVLDSPLVDDADVLADAAVLVENSPFDHRAVADTNVRETASLILGTFRVSLEPVGANGDGVFDCHIAANAAPQTDDTVGNLRSRVNQETIDDQAL